MNGILYPIVSKVACLAVEAFSWYIKIAVQSRLFIGNYISFFFNPKIFVLIKPSIFLLHKTPPLFAQVNAARTKDSRFNCAQQPNKTV